MPDTHSSRISIVEGYSAAASRLQRRGEFVQTELSPASADRIVDVFGERLTARQVVDRIVDDVKAEGDAAVSRYTLAFDGRAAGSVEVPRDVWDSAWDAVGPELRKALTVAAERVRQFHERQLRQSWFHTEELGIFGQIVKPLERIGIYTPGGSAALPSSLLMTAIPARVAGVKDIVISAPPRHEGGVAPIILAAAKIADVDRVFAIGGAQAIAAMAFGTATVPHVDKILGPGNIFVALAKQRVFGAVDIDQIAGPTETMLIADDSADVEYAAADMLAQAEHDEQASAILVTTSRSFAAKVVTELERQLATLERAEIARASILRNGLIAIVDTLDEAIALSNSYAPEHLCLLVEQPWDLVPNVEHAGGIFIGEQSPEALGDYTAGPSHVMPTGGTARYSSPVNVGDFVKVISVVAGNSRAIRTLGPATIAFAQAEGLGGHASAIDRRLRRLGADGL
ncbi:MAG: Histidinol dehydrogenase [uncultured Thermomicrobiales bacterium]|uniref:Histidinol dehydrogenase n=1 Tax=uncultured Thermomicrobiales bacterium TaxID=1645740 RepID=A0A6J4UJG0_9BACT|nr:MAG: Histidinol dehydrogenase [uncultured Thermomicrobiales bacterium]